MVNHMYTYASLFVGGVAIVKNDPPLLLRMTPRHPYIHKEHIPSNDTGNYKLLTFDVHPPIQYPCNETVTLVCLPTLHFRVESLEIRTGKNRW